ncbi:glycoside hydrolase family 15 [Cellulomonas sp. PhB150]|uniref:glycoside hydrolase family 15 n=1 Tax=Cellulomonas sp. PhB150 TaxID=2485188 RepID=UPI0018F7CCA0|nr:glycoside hydrolase family 15 [Cellulomonas sp. PhB150]
MPGDDAAVDEVVVPPAGPSTRPQSGPRRRARARLGALVGAATVVAVALLPHAVPARASAPAPALDAPLPLHQDGVALLADGTRAGIADDLIPAFLPGSRVLDPAVQRAAQALGAPAAAVTDTAGARSAAAEQRAWLDSGTVPGAGGPYEDLARDALLDLRTLLLDDGATVAGWSPYWRYVWPRDASFVAVALARTGHVDDALDVLTFLARVQSPDGSFQARYLPDGSGPPDDRGVQVDGAGWALWAAGLVVDQISDGDARARAVRDLHPLVERSTQYLDGLIGADGLPPVSPDYWEVAESELTLGTAAPLVAGLQSATGLAGLAHDDDLARTASRAGDRLRAAVVSGFEPTGWARYARGGHVDAAVAFTLAPFWREPAASAQLTWRSSAGAMRRPAGGLAPGAAWRDDGISWTPQTTLYAWVAAEQGDAALAARWLDVVDSHRTPSGAIPEKILADGSPASVAPLSWSAACVVLAVDALG